MKLKQGFPISFDISYDVAEDGKSASDISDAKFFLATSPEESDDKWLLKTWNSGLTYLNGLWTVKIDQSDLDVAADYFKHFKGVLAIQYSGDTDFREPDLTEDGEPFLIYIERKYSG
jgi:hypothetical protein